MVVTSHKSVEHSGLPLAIPLRIRCRETAAIAIETLPELCQAGDRLGVHAGPCSLDVNGRANQVQGEIDSRRQRRKDRHTHSFVIHPFHGERGGTLSKAQCVKFRLRAAMRNVNDQIQDCVFS